MSRICKMPSVGDAAEFPYPIASTRLIGRSSVVILNVPPDDVLTENVFGVSDSNLLQWQIERIADTATDPSNVYMDFVSPMDAQCQVDIANWNGTVVTVDAVNGAIVKTRFSK